MTPMETALDLAMARVGDRWTLQVVEALLEGPLKFSELEQSIPGVAPNVLSARLRRLEGEGLVAATAYSERPPRHHYRLTPEGRELGGAVMFLTRWGARQLGPDSASPRHEVCGTPLEPRWYCPTCAQVTEDPAGDLTWL